jgi:prenyltransferase beta subunit
MLQVARLAPKQLGDSCDLVAGFLLGQMSPDGGFRDRAGNSDLYYTVFGLEGLVGLGVQPPVSQTAAYLRTFGAGEDLDFVHLACLARCWATVSRDLHDVPRDLILQRIESFRTANGYNQTPGAPHGALYASFLAMGAYQDLRCEMPERRRLLDSIAALKAGDGGYANRPGMAAGLTTTTAAAVTLLRHLQQEIDPRLGEWLLARCRPEGGFFASPAAPVPDLLSTASALHALSGMQVSLREVQEPCLDFVDSLWNNRGGFYGSWADDTLDCEYTYYALLALGHLSLY